MSTGYHGGYRRNPIPPGEGVPVGCGCLAALFVGTLLAWLVVPAIFLIGTFLATHCLYVYLRRLAEIMGIGPGALPAPIASPPDTATGRAEPAFTHYLFGPALIDLRHAVHVALPAPLQVGREYDQRIRRAFQYRYPSWLMVPLGVIVWLGMAGGVIGGFVLVGLLGVLQLAVVVALALGVIAAGLTLRVIDSAMRRVKGIRTSCPSCHLRVNYPSYECFGTGCGRRHRDVRPGRYGVLKRRCACGTQLPTLLLVGSGDGRMKAYCPHCTEPMSRGAGTVTEVVIPVLGAAATGKTRLMTALVMGLLEGHTGYGAEAEFVDDESESAYRKLAAKLRAGVHTWKTIKTKDAPLRAYSLRIRPPTGAARLFHIFDAPGELVAKSESLRELRYIKAARTFLFTIDMLSIDAVWESLEPRVRAQHNQLRSDLAPDFVFGQLVQNIEGHGVQMSRARLAVALTKNDLVRNCAALAGVGDASEDIRRWLEGPAGLDGMVRAMRLSFAEVTFFRTSSWLEHGEIDYGVLDLAGWILIKEGLRVHHSLG
ncbi:MAG TPA: hypothetical protein VE465_21840 [Streptosporangiaceae bacterium]|nr:hypothetical protein [Streptosporangiaceae bacterium]